MRRVACISLPEIRIEIAAEKEDPVAAAPLAVVIARPGGSVKTDQDVLGGTKLDVVSHPASAFGLRAGQTVASARARCENLRVRVVAEEAVRFALERVAEMASAFGPTVAFDVAQDVVWVEVTGCAHLFESEQNLARSLDARVRELGHACRVAIAEGPRIAAAVARFAPEPGEARLAVPEGKGKGAMHVLPIAALALSDDTHVWLKNLGLRTCGDLHKLPRRSLGTRLGARVHDVIKLLDGEDRAPLDAWHPPEVPEERVELEWGARSIEALTFVHKTLCDRLAARLLGRAVAAAKIEVTLGLDRALCPGQEATRSYSIALPAPIARASDLLAVVRTRLERETLPAPVLSATIRAFDCSPRWGRPLFLMTPEPKAETVLPALVGELVADLGAPSVGVLDLVDTWNPDERTRLVPWGRHREAPCRHSRMTSAPEPSRIVAPERLPCASLAPGEILLRLQAIRWWSESPRAGDFCAAWASGPEGHAWVELHGENDAVLRGWFD